MRLDGEAEQGDVSFAATVVVDDWGGEPSAALSSSGECLGDADPSVRRAIASVGYRASLPVGTVTETEFRIRLEELDVDYMSGMSLSPAQARHILTDVAGDGRGYAVDVYVVGGERVEAMVDVRDRAGFEAFENRLSDEAAVDELLDCAGRWERVRRAVRIGVSRDDRPWLRGPRAGVVFDPTSDPLRARARIGWDFAGIGRLHWPELAVELGGGREVLVVPTYALATPHPLFIIPSPAVRVGVPVRVSQDAAIGFRAEAALAMMAFEVGIGVDVFAGADGPEASPILRLDLSF